MRLVAQVVAFIRRAVEQRDARLWRDWERGREAQRQRGGVLYEVVGVRQYARTGTKAERKGRNGHAANPLSSMPPSSELVFNPSHPKRQKADPEGLPHKNPIPYSLLFGAEERTRTFTP